MNRNVLILVGFLAISFVIAVIWKMDQQIKEDRSSWAQAQMRTQVSSLVLNLESRIRGLHRTAGFFQDGKRDKNFWQAAEPFQAVGWIRSLNNPILESSSLKEGTGLDDADLIGSLQGVQGVAAGKNKWLFLPWKDSQKRRWILVLWPWAENRYLALWAGPEFLQGALETFKGSLAELMFVNDNGQVLAHSQSEYFATRINTHPLFHEFKAEGTSQGGGAYNDGSGQKFLGQYSAVGSSNLMVLAHVPFHTLVSDKNKIWAPFLFAGLGLVLLTMGGMVLLQKQEPEPKATPKPVTPLPAPPSKVEVVPANSSSDDLQKIYRKIAVSLGHELRSPLSRILGFCQMILSKEKDAEVAAHVESILRESRQARDILEKLFAFAQEKEVATTSEKVGHLLQNVLTRFQPSFERKAVKVTQEIADSEPFEVSAPLLESAFTNILQNALEALDRKINKEIAVKLIPIEGGVEVTIEDTGEGIDEDKLDRVFDPFFTTRSYSRHLGLGLSSAFGVIRQHHGEIRLTSQRGLGTKVTIQIKNLQEQKPVEPKKMMETAPLEESGVFSPADVEIEKLMDFAEVENPGPGIFPEEDRDKIIVQTTTASEVKPAEKKDEEKKELKLEVREKPKSPLEDYKVAVRKPRSSGGLPN